MERRTHLSNQVKRFEAPKIQSEPNESLSQTVKDLDIQKDFVVSDFEMFHFGKSRRPETPKVSAAGVLGSKITQKSSRFKVSELLKDSLSIAEEEENEIQRRVNAEIEKVKKAAFDDAFQLGKKQGYEEGYKSGEEKGFEKGSAESEAIHQLLMNFENASSELFKANEEFLVNLTYRMAKMLFLKELSTDRDYVIRLASALIERTGLRENIRLVISESDRELIQKIESKIQENGGKIRNFSIETSDEIMSGGCKVESDLNTIDGQIETQLEGLRDAVLGK